MKSSFTLVEVIIAVVILALVGTALIKNGSDSLELLQKIRQKGRTSDYITIFANHRNPDFNHLTKALEDFLLFSSSDDTLRKILKQKFTYHETILKMKMPTLEGFDDEEEEDVAPQNPINVDFVKISYKNEKGGDFFYLLELH